jgi:hypothetical protein
LAYRSQGRPILMDAIANHAPSAELQVLCNPTALNRFVAALTRKSQ